MKRRCDKEGPSSNTGCTNRSFGPGTPPRMCTGSRSHRPGWYTYHRSHTAPGCRVPAAVARSWSPCVLASIYSGTGNQLMTSVQRRWSHRGMDRSGMKRSSVEQYTTIHAFTHTVLAHYTVLLGCLVSVVVGRRTSDREIASSTPGRCTAG